MDNHRCQCQDKMTNTYALTDYDVYHDEAYDDFRGRRRRRRTNSRRTRKLLKLRRSKPKLSRPPRRFTRPKVKRGRSIKLSPIRVVQGQPIKLPPIRKKTIPIIQKKIVQPKTAVIKTKKAPQVKAKTPISHLIKKSNPIAVKTPLSISFETEVKELQTVQKEAAKKAMKSDGKVSKVVIVIAVVGIVGATGFGIYKFIQKRKSQSATKEMNNL